jgi:NAD(P)-dependent dehydrogenase (short-subunit alcohol dehydrogenase family)
VVVADIQEELGLKVVASIAGPDVDRAIYKKCDVTVEKQLEETVAFAIEKYGTLDIMYSNAGIMGSWGSILEMDMVEGFDRTIAVNLRGPALCIKHAARAMVKRQVRGSIICTGSATSVLGGMGPHDYTTSKHGLVGLVRAAASELGKHGIRVNCVSPSGVATPLAMSGLSAMGMGINDASQIEALTCSMANLKGIALKAKHVAEAALFLASDESSIYVSGHNLAIDGGLTVVYNSAAIRSQMLIKQKQ